MSGGGEIGREKEGNREEGKNGRDRSRGSRRETEKETAVCLIFGGSACFQRGINGGAVSLH